MKNQIYKYELKIADYQKIQLPNRSRMLSVGEQEGKLMLWAIVDTEQEMHDTVISIRGTGHEVGDEYLSYNYDGQGYYMTHIGTVQMIGGLVWHVFSSKP